MIEAYNLSKAFDNRVLFKSLSFSLHLGINSIEGKSGSGKSTLIKLMMGIIQPDNGKVLYKKDGIVFSYSGQDNSLFRKYSLNKNISVLSSDIDEKRKRELSLLLDFKKTDKKISSLSGGERQKAEIIYCLSKKADVYFLDEPFSSIDVKTKKKLVEWLNAFATDHYIVLVNHDHSFDNLKIHNHIELSIGEEKVEPASFVYSKAHLTNRVGLAIKTYFRNRIWFSFIKGILLVAAFVLFAFGMSYVNTDSAVKRLETRMTKDPFSVHFVGFGGQNIVSDIPLDFYAYANEKGDGFLNLSATRGNRNVVFLGALKDSNGFYYYSNLENPLITNNQTISLGDEEYSLSIIGDEQLDTLLEQKSKFIQSIKDKYISNFEILFCTNQFIDEILLSSVSMISFSIDDLRFRDIGGINFDVQSGRVTFGGFTTLSSNVIEDRDDYYLALPQDMKGKTIRTSKGARIIVSSKSEDGKIHLSLPMLKYLEIESLQADIDMYSRFGYEFNDQDIISYVSKHPLSMFPVDCIFDDNYSNWEIITYFILSGLIFLIDLFLCFFTRGVQNRWYRMEKNVFQRNQFSEESLNIGLLISHYLEMVPALISSLICYFVYFIPLANEQLMLRKKTPTILEYGYYSQQPNNPYYDGIFKPLQWNHFEPLILILVLVFIILPLVHFVLISTKKKKKKAKRNHSR